MGFLFCACMLCSVAAFFWALTMLMVRRPRKASVRGSSALTALPTCTVWGECLYFPSFEIHFYNLLRELLAAIFLLKEMNIATHTFSTSSPLLFKSPAAAV